MKLSSFFLIDFPRTFVSKTCVEGLYKCIDLAAVLKANGCIKSQGQVDCNGNRVADCDELNSGAAVDCNQNHTLTHVTSPVVTQST